MAVAMPGDGSTNESAKSAPKHPDIARDMLDFINYSWTQFHAVGTIYSPHPLLTPT